MNARLQNFIARRVLLPLAGMTLGTWWSMLRRHRFAVAGTQWHRALIQTALACSNSVNARLESGIFGRRIQAAIIKEPLFILGHYRSGTTHLHNLLALDPGLAAPTLFEVLNPHTFLLTERLIAPLADSLVLRHRFQDSMAQDVGVPAEDEIALGTMTGLSPYLDWYFPRDASRYSRYLTGGEFTAAETTRWREALTAFTRKLAIYHGRRLVLKSPPHTARIGMLLDLFPDARFIHIHRHPYDVFRSTSHLIRSIQPVLQLQAGPILDDEAQILAVYTAMYDAYFAQRSLIPAGRLVEVAYADLRRDPIGVVESIYDALGMPDFDAVRPRLTAYLGSIADYRPNQFAALPESLRARIASAWSRSFTEWGYEL